MKLVTIAFLMVFALSQSPQARGDDITEEYLLGPWCYLHVDFGGSKEEENVNWDFKANGDLFAQQSMYSDKMKHSYNWKIEGKTLSINPLFGNERQVSIISEDRFSLKFLLGEAHFQRGECQ